MTHSTGLMNARGRTPVDTSSLGDSQALALANIAEKVCILSLEQECGEAIFAGGRIPLNLNSYDTYNGYDSLL